jgi:ankyrin repeat protein
MANDDEHRREARQFERIDAAFKAGDLAALRDALDDPSVIPNGVMPISIGACLIYAIYWSPIDFIRELLQLGADPDADDGDGFPSLIAALSKTYPHPGSMSRTDINEILALLLQHGANPNQRGFNDYTPLHKAVEQNNPRAIEILLAAGADRSLRTRLDGRETAGELARRSGFPAIADRLESAN